LLIILFFGFFSKISAIIILLIYTYTFLRSSLYGLEDIYLTSLTIYVALSNNFYYSLDNILGINKLLLNSYFFDNQLLPELLLSLFCSMIFFSSACEKLRSKIWRSGIAIKYFFIHPKNRKINLEYLGRKKSFSIVSGAVVMISQGLLFFCLFLPSKYGLLIIFSLLIFALMLSVFFLYVGLAEACILILLIQLYLFFHLWDMSGFEFFLNSFNNFSLLEKSFSYFILFVSSIYLLNQFFSKSFEGRIVRNSLFIKWIFKLPRIFLGLLRVGVYTEEHLSNPIAFRVYAYLKNKKIKELFQIYNDDGTPYLKRVTLIANVYMCIAFKIHDILIELDNKAKLSSFNRKFLSGYLRFLLKEKRIDPENLEKIVFKINQLNIDDVVKKNAKLNNEMTPLLEIKILSDFDFKISHLKKKLLQHKSQRIISERFKII